MSRLRSTANAIGPAYRPTRRATWTALTATIVLAGCGTSSPSITAYGGAPTFLPPATAAVHRTIPASARRPQLGTEGDTFAATVADGRALVTVVGPLVPASGLTPPPPRTPATFVITISWLSGTVSLRPSAFTVVDGAGQVHRLGRFLAAAGSLVVGPSRTPVTVRAATVLATGPGTLRWAPDGAPVASWDFTVEID